jgi:hypothetical protein
MKVIKPGRTQTGWSMRKKCTGGGNGEGGCGALLLVEQADVFRTESHARDETTRYATFECPCCGVLTDFDSSEVPAWLFDRLKKQKEWLEERGNESRSTT